MNAETDFRVSVEAAFDEDGTWVIDTAVKFRDGLAPEAIARLVGDVRLALLVGIWDRGREGRALGATRVHVRLDDPARRFLPDLPPSLEPVQ